MRRRQGPEGGADRLVMNSTPYREGRRSVGESITSPKIKYRRPGRQVGPPPSRAALVRLYVEGNQTARDVAAALGCSKDMVIRSLADYGIKVRTRTKRSKLLAIALNVLEAGVRDKGVRGYARDIGVDESTLRHHLKVRRCQ